MAKGNCHSDVEVLAGPTLWVGVLVQLKYLVPAVCTLNKLYAVMLPYSGLFSWGANFRYFHGQPTSHKIFHPRILRSVTCAVQVEQTRR